MCKLKTTSVIAVMFPAISSFFFFTPEAAAADLLDNMWLVTVFNKGGLVMWPILGCSILALAISLERAVRLRHDKIINRQFIDYIDALAEQGDFEKALELCKSYDKLAMSRVVNSGIRRAQYGILEMERAIEMTGAHEATLLQANLRGLGVLGNLTPMLGLLGTVIGMIKAFNVISEMGTGNPNLVAAGISEALITTAAGLIVGIPTLAMYHYFKGKVDKFIYEMEEVSLRLVENIQNSVNRAKRQKKSQRAGGDSEV